MNLVSNAVNQTTPSVSVYASSLYRAKLVEMIADVLEMVDSQSATNKSLIDEAFSTYSPSQKANYFLEQADLSSRFHRIRFLVAHLGITSQEVQEASDKLLSWNKVWMSLDDDFGSMSSIKKSMIRMDKAIETYTNKLISEDFRAELTIAWADHLSDMTLKLDTGSPPLNLELVNESF